jgi:hypothetical protein
MTWKFDAHLATLSTADQNEISKKIWEGEDLGGLTEDNNRVPKPIVALLILTVLTAFAITFPLWGQRPTAALYLNYVNAMDKPEIQAIQDDTEAMKRIVAMNKGSADDALLERHPTTMDQLRLLKPQIQALQQKGVDLKDYTVVGERVVLANFEGNYRADGSRIRQQPWWDKGYTIDIFYVIAFFLGVTVVIKRLPPTKWQPRHGKSH